jgi:hypothetical protein
MKGEVLPAFTRWAGIPTRPVEAVARKSVQAAGVSQIVPAKPRRERDTKRDARARGRIYAQLLNSSSPLAIQSRLAIRPGAKSAQGFALQSKAGRRATA